MTIGAAASQGGELAEILARMLLPDLKEQPKPETTKVSTTTPISQREWVQVDLTTVKKTAPPRRPPGLSR